MSNPANHLYEFGLFRLDTAEHTLLRDGHAVSLTPKAYEVLLALVRRAGHIVEKDELMRDIWADAFVEEGNLTHHIFTLRKALGEGSNGREYIETIPRRGYRFVSPVREVRDESIELAENHTGLVTPSADKATASTAARIENLTGGTMGYKKGAVLTTVLLVFTLAGITLYK
jgi:DNA-binding winged helix-turn-helix (wHTH) protein